ncbi:MAG: hypothetical protein AB1630_02605 [bacterium]
MNIAIFLMAIVGCLLLVEIINFSIKYKRKKERKDLVSLIIMGISFIFWAISTALMIKKL